MCGISEMAAAPKVETKYEYTEDELIEIKKLIEPKRKLLFGHPEGPDYQAVWGFEQHLIRRLSAIAWEKYTKDKGLDFTK